MAKITNYLSAILILLVLIQLAPSLFKSIKHQYEGFGQLKTKVAVLKIKNEIGDVSHYIKNLNKFFEKDDIKAIFIKIESPGGTAGSSKALFDEILSLKKEYPKPIVVLTNDLCASGGYYIACAADHIIASSTAIVGSIGSYIGTFKVKELIESWKIKYNIKQSGKYKTTLNPFTDSTQETNEFLQAISDDVYDQFKSDVAIRRKLSLADSDKWANGKFFTGRQALQLKLVDEIGSEYNAIKKIRELAMIEKDKKIDWVKPEKISTYERLFGEDEDEDTNQASSLIDVLADKICAKLGICASPKPMA